MIGEYLVHHEHGIDIYPNLFVNTSTDRRLFLACTNKFVAFSLYVFAWVVVLVTLKGMSCCPYVRDAAYQQLYV